MDRSAETKKTSYNFGCFSWPATALTIAIIAVRAFQPGADPIAEWSFKSWMLMLLPMYWPILLWGTLLVLAGLASAFSGGNR